MSAQRDFSDVEARNDAGAATAPGPDHSLGFDLVSLARSAAQLRSARLAFADDSRNDRDDSLSFSAFNDTATGFANAMRAFGLRPGERVLIAGYMSSRCFAAIIGCLAAGLDTAIAGLHLDDGELAAFAGSIGASAIISDVEEDERAQAALVFAAAAKTESVRLVISLAHVCPDGAISISAASAASAPEAADENTSTAGPRIITRNARGAPAVHKQETLITAGLDFISRAQIGAGTPIVSTIVPASFAGLVCGPVAALLSGANTVLHVPFDSKRLIERIESIKPVQLVAPGAIAPHLAASAICNKEHISSLVLLTRLTDTPADFESLSLPAMPAHGFPVCDLLAFGEIAAVAECRTIDGKPRIPLQSNHTIHMDGRETLAVRAIKHMYDRNGDRCTAIALEGAAVSSLDWKHYEPTD